MLTEPASRQRTSTYPEPALFVDGRWEAGEAAADGVIEQIARLVGHTGGSTVTETVYRKQLRPIIDEGAAVMDRVFGARSASAPPPRAAGPGAAPER